MVTLNVPETVGVPEIIPVVVFMVKPAGNPVAPKLVGLLVAVIWYEYGTPTVRLPVVGLLIFGFATANTLSVADSRVIITSTTPSAILRLEKNSREFKRAEIMAWL